MAPSQQSSIRSFFRPRNQSDLPVTAPPSSATNAATKSPTSSSPPPAPSAPPLPLGTSSKPTENYVILPPSGVPVLPSPPSLPQGATIAPLEPQHIPALRRINSLVLPVPYPDSFYTKAVEPLGGGLFSRVILWQDSERDQPKVIGGLVCRVEPDLFVDAEGRPVNTLPDIPRNPPPITKDMRYHSVYVQSLALLSPYRGLGIAAAALDHIIATALLLPAAGSSLDVRTVYAHVWSENVDGLRWYESRGFSRVGGKPVEGYYFKLRPNTAWVMRKHIGPSADSPATNPTPANTAASPPPVPKPTVLTEAINLSTQPSTATSTQPPSRTSPQPPSSATFGPPRRPPASTNPPSASSSTLSFQNARPATEWNDLPEDMISAPPRSSTRSLSQQQDQQDPLLAPPPPGSGVSSSRSSSTTGRKKRERAYPTAAFGPP
ncbi:hypothetical protein VTJ04DRAFT_7452 [Mycothermus thermophilus]|uniref:uncharacterized protein n=1 Tax=Humicola insolens TaxID=85995 RepID=UPI00374220CE